MILDKIQAQAEKMFPETVPAYIARRKTWCDGVHWALEQTKNAASKASSNTIIQESFKAIEKHAREDNGRITNLSKALAHIQGLAGHPDAAEGCRNIIKRATQAQEELLESYKNV